MTEKNFGVVLRAVDPGKLGNLVKKNLISEVTEDTDEGLTYFKSGFSKRELKVKLGLVYDQDIIEYAAQKDVVKTTSDQTNSEIEKTDNTPEVTEKAEIPEVQQESDLNKKALKLKEKESDLNLKAIELSEKQAELENKIINSNSENHNSIMGDKVKQKLRIEIPEIYGTEYCIR